MKLTIVRKGTIWKRGSSDGCKTAVVISPEEIDSRGVSDLATKSNFNDVGISRRGVDVEGGVCKLGVSTVGKAG